MPARTDTENRLRDALTRHPGSTAAQLADLAKIGRSTATKTLARWATSGHVHRHNGPTGQGPRPASLWTPATRDRRDTARQHRLAPGELRAAVQDYLATPERHGQSFTPGQIARALGRSAGAVANALHRLTADGRAAQTSDQPRRYTHTPPPTDRHREQS